MSQPFSTPHPAPQTPPARTGAIMQWFAQWVGGRYTPGEVTVDKTIVYVCLELVNGVTPPGEDAVHWLSLGSGGSKEAKEALEEAKAAKKLAEETVTKLKAVEEAQAAQETKTEAIEGEITGELWTTGKEYDPHFASFGAPFFPLSTRAHLGRGELRGAAKVLETFTIAEIEGAQHVFTLEQGIPAAEVFTIAPFIAKGQIAFPQAVLIEPDGKLLIYSTGTLHEFQEHGYLSLDCCTYPL